MGCNFNSLDPFRGGKGMRSGFLIHEYYKTFTKREIEDPYFLFDHSFDIYTGHVENVINKSEYIHYLCSSHNLD